MSGRPTVPGRPKRVGVISLGCAKNLVDTEVMLAGLDRAGCEFVRDAAEAEILLVNTCAFIESAREESIRTILEAAEYKKTGCLERLVVAGCMVQRYAEELRRELPEVDAFIGLDELDRVVERAGLAARLAPANVPGDVPPAPASASRRPSSLHVVASSSTPRASRPAASAPAPSTRLWDESSPRRLATPAWSAYLKIAEGCDHTCAFCAIPSFRGSFRSRSLDGLVGEAEHLAASGVRELNLIAQDTSRYGRDLGQDEGLATLLERLDAVAELRWIRLHYLYPNTITDRLVATMARLPRVVPYVDLPLQHAHRDVLRRMRRGGSAEEHLRLLARLRAAMPDAVLRTTFIVGFPGETEREFETLTGFLAEARFDHVGAFVYSHEEGTPAAVVDDDVPAETKRERHERLLDAQQPVALARRRAQRGRTLEVLVEGAHPETEHLLVGRWAGQAPGVDGQVLLNEGEAAPGTFARARITGLAGYDLVGRLLGPA